LNHDDLLPEGSEPVDFHALVDLCVVTDLQAFVTGYLSGCVRGGLPLDVEPHYDGRNLAPGFRVTNPATGAAVVVSVDLVIT